MKDFDVTHTRALKVLLDDKVQDLERIFGPQDELVRPKGMRSMGRQRKAPWLVSLQYLNVVEVNWFVVTANDNVSLCGLSLRSVG